jgi:hypothetical protein
MSWFSFYGRAVHFISLVLDGAEFKNLLVRRL